MAKRTRMILIGGFLGAGKTTLINKMAQQLISEKRPIGIITNDQGQLLVDTEFIKVRGINVEEVPGGCFCCNFPKLIENAERLVGNVAPEYILAEPVGSCTDLIATVALPLKKYYGEMFSTAPLMVLIDGPKLMDNAFDKDTLGGYLRSHQAEEAEVLILTKTDLLGADDIKSLVKKLKGMNPGAEIITYSAVNNEGFDKIMDVLRSDKITGRRPVDVDYDKYADAEAELGWYNGVFLFNSEKYDAYDLSMAMLRDLAAKYSPKDIAHAKIALTSDQSHTKISLIGNEFSIGGVHGSRFGKGESQLNFNARIVSEPDALRRSIRETVAKVMKSKNIEYNMKFDDCFSPGRPNPTHRLV
jgi:Ni2+-binding GTPase involved in maturation of urease and hydrogenase